MLLYFGYLEKHYNYIYNIINKIIKKKSMQSLLNIFNVIIINVLLI